MAEGWAATENFSDEQWDKTSTAPPPPPAPGVYIGKIVGAAEHMAGSGKACAKIDVSLVGLRGGEQLERPRKITDYVTVTSDGMYKVKQYTAAAGAPKNPTNNSSEAINEWCQTLVGQDVIVKVRADSFVPHNSTEKVPSAKIDRPLTSAEADQAQGLAAAPVAAGGSRRRNGAAA